MFDDSVVSTLNAAFARPAKGHTGKTAREQALEHVRGLLKFLGDNPDREGLRDTPDRVLRAYEEQFAGYQQDPAEFLKKTFEEVEGYDELVLVSDIELASHCEHHMVPFIGKAHVAYIPSGRVVGLSKLARVVDVYARAIASSHEWIPRTRSM